MSVRLSESDFDAVVVGTGLISALLSSALARAKLRVLHCDENGYYGSDDASFHLEHFEYLARGALERLPNCRFGASKPTRGDIADESSADSEDCSTLNCREYRVPKHYLSEDSALTRFCGNHSRFEWTDYCADLQSVRVQSERIETDEEDTPLSIGSVWQVKSLGAGNRRRMMRSSDDSNGFDEVYYILQSHSSIVQFERVNLISSRKRGMRASRVEERYPPRLVLTVSQIPRVLYQVSLDLRTFFLIDSIKYRFRKIIVDLKPNLVYANGQLIDAVVSAGVHQYCEFRPMNENSLITIDESSRNIDFLKVPLSRSEVFKNQNLKLKEKRRLMKFIQGLVRHLNAEDHTDDGISGGQFKSEMPKKSDMKKDEDCLSETIESFDLESELNQLSPRLADWIRYGIAFMDYPQSKSGDSSSSSSSISKSSISISAMKCKTDDPSVVMRRLRLFLSSVGRFSSGALLFPIYGCGELPSGFCRSSAVKGSIFVLSFGLQSYITKPMMMETERMITDEEMKQPVRRRGREKLVAVRTDSKQRIGCKYAISTASYIPATLVGGTVDEECEDEDDGGLEKAKEEWRSSKLAAEVLQNECDEVIVRMVVVSDTGVCFVNDCEDDDEPNECVAHIPVDHSILENQSSVHYVRLSSLSLCCPPGIRLNYFWTVVPNNRSSIDHARIVMHRCFDLFFDKPDAKCDSGSVSSKKKPWAGCRSIWEQNLSRKGRPSLSDDHSRLPDGLFVLDDCCNDSFGFDTDIELAKKIFDEIMRREGKSVSFMEEWVPPEIAAEKATESRADEVFGALPEILDDQTLTEQAD